MKRHPRHITVTRRWPERYFMGISKPLQKTREKELLKRRTSSGFKMGKTNLMVKPKKSKWTTTFHKVYPGLKFNKNVISQKTGIPRSNLDTVYDRGIKAWKMGGSRVGATPQQWAIARMFKYILISKKKVPKSWYETKFDPDNYLRRPKSSSKSL